jgi:hypothetical protein
MTHRRITAIIPSVQIPIRLDIHVPRLLGRSECDDLVEGDLLAKVLAKVARRGLALVVIAALGYVRGLLRYGNTLGSLVAFPGAVVCTTEVVERLVLSSGLRTLRVLHQASGQPRTCALAHVTVRRKSEQELALREASVSPLLESRLGGGLWLRGGPTEVTQWGVGSGIRGGAPDVIVPE